MLQVLELLLANALFQRLAGRQISKRRIAGGNIRLDDQRIGVFELFELFEQTGGQGSHIVAAHMNTANQMKMAIAGKRDIDSRPGVMITAQRGPKAFLPGTTDPYDLPL
ncbi:Uncharacterised protein [Escherichia coli]|uniref:Uncharacterized protein n=1 Tax=Escherichia coli TaxID=562 RepID=A0A377DI83_ECOLX|nr:Uncharacterised protein [Escherichia coli]